MPAPMQVVKVYLDSNTYNNKHAVTTSRSVAQEQVFDSLACEV